MAECRGGAGGANASKNKQLTEALDALTKVMKAFGEEDEDEEVTSVRKEIGKVVKEWENKLPTKGEVREQLRKFHSRLEEKARAPVQPTPSGETEKRQQQQSFYTEFARSIRREDESEWKTKGKDKGTSKTKKDCKEVTKFDLRRDFPQRRIGPWQLVSKELEIGRESTASISVVDSVRRIVELQAISREHSLKQAVILVAKKEGTEDIMKEIVNAKEILLPLTSNLALVKAIVATTTGEAPQIEGIAPKEDKEETHKQVEKPATLRVVVDLKFKAAKVKALEEKPHLSLHEISKS